MHVIDGRGGLYMAFMVVEFSIYVIDGRGGLFMAFMVVEFNICH